MAARPYRFCCCLRLSGLPWVAAGGNVLKVLQQDRACGRGVHHAALVAAALVAAHHAALVTAAPAIAHHATLVNAALALAHFAATCRFQQLLPQFPLRGSGTDFFDLRDDCPDALDGVFPHDAVL